MLEARVEVWLEPQLDDDRVVVAVDMCVNTIQAFEDVTEKSREGLREWDADSAREHLLIVDVALNPRHQVLDILWCGHLCRLLVVLAILPEVFKSEVMSMTDSDSSEELTRLWPSSRDSSGENRTR